MKKRLLVLYLLLAVSMLLKVQTLSAQKDFVLNLPGGSAGANSNMSIPALNTLITNYPFTIEMWVKPNAITAYDGFFYDKSSTKTSFQFANATTGEVRFDLFGTSNVVPLSSAKKLSVGKWQHLAVTVYADSAVVEIDGSFYAAAHTKAFDNFCTVGPTIGWDKDVADRAFTGLMDDIRIWNTARSRSEIESGKNSTLAGTETGLVAYYNFDGNNANDVTANALNGTLTGATVLDLKSISTLDNITLTGGKLIPAFSPSTTTYTVISAADSETATGVASVSGVATVSAPVALSAANATATIVCTSGDGNSTTTYTLNYTQITMDDWDGNDITGATSYPNMWGWDNTTTAIPWNTANSTGGCRYRDYNVTNGHTTFTYESDGSTSTSRQLMLRFDNGAYSSSYYSYPVKLESCKTYDFDWDYVLGGSGTPPNTITVGIDTTKTGAGRLSSKTFTTTSSQTVYRHGTYTFTTGQRAGVYYLTINAGAAAWYGVTNLSLKENTTPAILVSQATLAFNNVTKSIEFGIKGNVLTSDVTITAPTGITLSRTTIPVAETECSGTSVTATYDFTQDVASGDIVLVSGEAKDTVRFTFTKPTFSFVDTILNVENNGKAYQFRVKSDNNTVDTLYVSASDGFSLSKDKYTADDMISGSFIVKVKTLANVGTTGKLIFYSSYSGVEFQKDSVDLVSIAVSPRYYIKHNAGGLVIGNHTSGLYPALTEKTGAATQKFFLRKVNIDPAASVDTFNIVQDASYLVMKKVATSNWDTELGIPDDNAKWTRQDMGSGIYTITNTATNKVLGTDAVTANSRLYDDKAYSAGGNMEWLFVDASTEDASLLSLSLNAGTIMEEFNSDSLTYTAVLPYGTASVTPTAVATISGATITGADAVDVSSGAGTSTIVVTATDGTTQRTYTITYSYAPNTDASLSDLKVGGTTVTGFATDVYTYNMELPSGTTTTPEVTATATDANAGVNVTPATAVPGATTVVVTAEDGTTQLTYTINFTLPTGVKLLNGASVTVYPSVTNGSFTVETTDASGTITVLDITGKVVSKQAISGPVQTVDVVNTGIYFINVESKNASVIVKVVKTK